MNKLRSWMLGIVVAAGPVQAADPGDLDIGFSGDGKATVSVGTSHNRGFALAVQSDDKLVIAGSRLNGDDDFSIVRLTDNGSLDTSFDSDGRVSVDFSANTDIAYGVAVQSDGRIVSAGTAFVGGNFDFALTRHTSSGALDTSFDTDGRKTILFGPGDDVGQALAIQSDGKLVVAGYSWNGLDDDFAIARFNADGSLDTSFSGDGRQTTDFGVTDIGRALAIQGDGKILVAGTTGTDLALVRYNTDGSLDAGFGTAGRVTTALGGNEQGFAIALQSDGKILVAGSSDAAGSDDFVIVRYLSDGSLDTSFDSDGVQSFTFGLGTDRAYALALQSDGKILVGGVAVGPSNNDFALARLTSAGALDTSFSADGKVLTNFAAGADVGRALGLQSTGRILLAGYSAALTDDDVAVARYRDVSGGLIVDPDGGGGGGSGGGCTLGDAASRNGLELLLALVVLLAWRRLRA